MQMWYYSLPFPCLMWIMLVNTLYKSTLTFCCSSGQASLNLVLKGSQIKPTFKLSGKTKYIHFIDGHSKKISCSVNSICNSKSFLSFLHSPITVELGHWNWCKQVIYKVWKMTLQHYLRNETIKVHRSPEFLNDFPWVLMSVSNCI